MARYRKKKHEREAEFRLERERMEKARREAREEAFKNKPPEENWDTNNGQPAPASDDQLLFNETKEDKLTETPDEVPPEVPPEPMTPPPAFPSAEVAPEPPAPAMREPEPRPEEIPPEMPPEMPPAQPEMPEELPAPEENTYEEDLLAAEEKERIAAEVQQNLQESFMESDEWWNKWDEDLEELMKL